MGSLIETEFYKGPLFDMHKNVDFSISIRRGKEVIKKLCNFYPSFFSDFWPFFRVKISEISSFFRGFWGNDRCDQKFLEDPENGENDDFSSKFLWKAGPSFFSGFLKFSKNRKKELNFWKIFIKFLFFIFSKNRLFLCDTKIP